MAMSLNAGTYPPQRQHALLFSDASQSIDDTSVVAPLSNRQPGNVRRVKIYN